ncbi:MAG: EamA family transporter RarD [Pseudomonadaceae bacterium]|nr:EamA family transporter RarD [Pseudomonadaceae bacterium]
MPAKTPHSSGPAPALDAQHVTAAGTLFALGAYVAWGVAPIYFKVMGHVPPAEMVAHRVVWSVLLLGIALTVARSWGDLRRLDRAKVSWLLVSALLLSSNWWIFIWALQNERMLETAVGYYINPLINVVLGYVLLGERLRSVQWLAIAVASLGVVNEVVAGDHFPWIGLSLALTFGFYGLVRKQIGVGSLSGLAIETSLMLPLAAGYLLYLLLVDGHTFGRVGLTTDLGLVFSSVVTSFPLACFAAAALRMPLSILGLFQYVAPTIAAVLAVWVYGEPFRDTQVITFGCVLLGLAIFSIDGLRARRRALRVIAR